MSPFRFSLDLVIQMAALVAGPYVVRRWPAVRPVVLGGTLLAAAGILATVLQAAGVETGFKALWISGLGFSWGLAVCAAAGVAWVFQRLPEPVSPERRRVLQAATNVLMAAPAVVLAEGIVIGRRQFHLQEVELAFPNLPQDLDGLRLVQLSDIHLSPFLSRSDVARCVDMANETKAQVALVTGDLITGVHDSIDNCLDELRRLHADAGVFGCMGNHERYVDGEAYTAEQAARRGMLFLRQQRTALRFGNATLNLAGVDHQARRATYLRGADALLRPDQWNLLLSHNPDVFPVAAAQGWDLTLAGHMHGGQINVELMQQQLNLARIRTPYVYGTYREGRSAIYVTRGIGTIGIPARFGAPPEVVLIRLRRG